MSKPPVIAGELTSSEQGEATKAIVTLSLLRRSAESQGEQVKFEFLNCQGDEFLAIKTNTSQKTGALRRTITSCNNHEAKILSTATEYLGIPTKYTSRLDYSNKEFKALYMAAPQPSPAEVIAKAHNNL